MNAQVGADERLVVALEARVSEFERRMKQAEQRGSRSYRELRRNSQTATRQMEADMLRATSSMNTALATTSAKIGSFGKAFLGSFAVGAVGALGAGQLASSIRGTVAELSGLAKVADRIGIGTEALQGLQRGFDLSGVAAEDLNKALEIFTRNIGQAVNGAGPLSQSLDQFGISVRNSNGEIKSQLELLKEVADVMRALPSDAQRMDLATKAFGRGGAAMVNAMREGGDSIDAMMDAAREAGVVIEDDLIRRAEILDDKFAELSRSVGTWIKRLLVGVADAAVALTDFRDDLDSIFATPEEARAILGDDLADALAANRDLVDANAEALGRLNGQYVTLAEEARGAGMEMRSAIGTLDSWGYDEIADALRAATEEMDRLAEAFQRGEISGEELTEALAAVEQQASEALAQLDATDRASFNGVISRLGRLGGVIASVTALALGLRDALAETAGVSADQQRGEAMRQREAAERASMQSLEALRRANQDFLATEQARNSASAEQLRLQREIEAVMRRAEEAGASITRSEAERLARAALDADAARSGSRGGSGRSGRASGGSGRGAADDGEFDKLMDQTRQRIAALEAEAASLVAAATSGREYADALEFARKRAELLHAAQRDGRDLTPELRAEVDALAEAYMTAGLEAEDAARRMREIQEQTKRGADALEDIFGAVLQGSDNARQAVIRLLAEIARIRMMRALFALPGFGSVASGLGNILTPPTIPGFANGGDHAGGLRVVGERGPEIEATGPARYWTADQTKRMLGGYKFGGGGGGAGGGTTRVKVDLSPDLIGKVIESSREQTVEIAHTAMRQGFEQYDRTLPRKMDHFMRYRRDRLD
ncbi:hypothetical protein [Paracoccus sp. NSM]|uniref:hypothetical protein n=1 Tax=Paracoccus sp. NSM TaxID=3457784 RepID=UPI004036D37C